MTAALLRAVEPAGGIRPGDAAFAQALRIVEAVLFRSTVPLPADAIARRLPEGVEVRPVLAELMRLYASRGINLVRVAGGYAFRTAADLAPRLAPPAEARARKLSGAALETLAIVAYHQPTTRAEIEAIRGVATGRGTLDALIETGWVRLRGRRQTPGRPVTYGTTPAFLDHFGLDAVSDLPGLDDLKRLGFADERDGDAEASE